MQIYKKYLWKYFRMNFILVNFSHFLATGFKLNLKSRIIYFYIVYTYILLLKSSRTH